MYKKISPFFQEANRKGKWNFNVNWFEPAQIAQYSQNEFYNWHVDEHDAPYPPNHPNKNFRNKIRKVSCSLFLSDSQSFEGGSLDFAVPTCRDGNLVYKKINVKAMGIGTLIFFPSFIAHQVNPVTKGIRKALVLWGLGAPYA